MFLLYEQEQYKQQNEDGCFETHYEPAKQFTLWEHKEDALAYVQSLVEKDFRHCTNIPADFRIEDGMIKFNNTLHGKVIEVCDFDYYIREFCMDTKPYIAQDVKVNKSTRTPSTWTFGGRRT